MCLAIYKPAKLAIPEANMKEGWMVNPDGAGMAYISKKKVVIEKGFMKWLDFLEAYKQAFNAHKNSPFLIHFRTQTHGMRSEDNTHPFKIKGGAMIHNGWFSGSHTYSTSQESDSRIFAGKFGDYLDFDTVEANKKELEQILVGNKVAILYDDGRFQIINGMTGTWDSDIWYSNACFKPRIASRSGVDYGWSSRLPPYGPNNPLGGYGDE